MLRCTFRKLLAKEEANKPGVLNFKTYHNFSSYIYFVFDYLSNEGLIIFIALSFQKIYCIFKFA